MWFDLALNIGALKILYINCKKERGLGQFVKTIGIGTRRPDTERLPSCRSPRARAPPQGQFPFSRCTMPSFVFL
jgi:hypothetical protein